MPTATAASEIAPPPHPRDELKSLALEADQFFSSDDWKNADAPTRQKYLDRTAEVFDEAFASAESSLDAAEADSFYNSTTAFLQGKMAEHNSRDADEKRRRAAADKSMQVFTERQKVTPEQVSGVVKRSLEVAGGMSAQARGSGVMKLDGEQGEASIGVQPLDWTPSAEEFWKDRYDLTASEAEKKSAKDFARSKGKDSLADDLLYRSAVAGEESAKLAARDIAFSKGADAAGVAAAEREATSAYRRNAKLAALESTQSSDRNPKGRKLPFRVVRINGMLNIEPEEGKAEEAMMAAERMGLLTSEEAARLIPSGAEMDKEFASRPKAQGGLVTAVKEFGSAILPALGTAAGTAIGAAASKGDVSTAMVGGASGGSAALWLQNKVFGQVDQAQREANARAHPGWAQVGSFVPFLVSMFQKTPPALTTVGKMAQAAKVSLEPGTAAARWESALQSGVAMGRAGFSSGVQQRYVEGNKDVNPIDEGVRSFIAGGAMGILKPAKGILMAMTGKAVKDAAAVTFAEGLYDLAVHNKPIDFKAIADEAPGTFTAFALQNAVMGVFHKFQHRREMAKMAGKSAAAANTAAAEAAEAQAKRFRKDGFIESAIASEALAETHRRAAKQDEKAATEQYWKNVANAQKTPVVPPERMVSADMLRYMARKKLLELEGKTDNLTAKELAELDFLRKHLADESGIEVIADTYGYGIKAKEAAPQKPPKPPESSVPAPHPVIVMIDSAVAAHANELAALGHPSQLTLVTMPEGDTGLRYNPNTGRIEYDPVALERQAARMAPRQRAEWIKRAVSEEVLHAATDKYASESPENRAKLYDILKDKDAVAAAEEAYGKEAFDGLDTNQKAFEVARVLLQGPRALTEAAYRFFKGLLRWLDQKLKNLSPDTKELLDGIKTKLEAHESGKVEDAKTARVSDDEMSRRRTPLSQKDRRSLQSRAEEAVARLTGPERAWAERRLEGISRNHQQIRREHADAKTVGEKLRLEIEMVEAENDWRKITGEAEIDIHHAVTAEDIKKNAERLYYRAQEIKAKLKNGEAITPQDRQDWKIAGMNPEELPKETKPGESPAKPALKSVEHTQANEGPLTERAAYGRTGDVYDAFGNVQRKAGEPKNEKAQSVPSVQKADEPVRLPQKEVAPAAPSPEPATPAAAKPVEQPAPAAAPAPQAPAPGVKEQIDRIVSMAEQPMPKIVESVELLYNDGKWRSPVGGAPMGVSAVSPVQRRIAGYVIQNPEGTTGGVRLKTREEQEQRQRERIERTSAEFRKALEEMTPEQLASQEKYWADEKAKRARLAAPLPSQKKPVAEDSDAAKLRDLQKVRYKTAAQEKNIEILKARVAADPSKWKVGDGISYKVNSGGVGSQTNRGFRIVRINPESKLALVRSVADTGLTSSGGDADRIGDQWIHVAELKRDKKYDAPAAAPTPQAPAPGVKGVEEAVFTREEIDVSKPSISRRKRPDGTDGESVTEISAPSSVTNPDNWNRLGDINKLSATVEARLDFASGKTPKKTDQAWTAYGGRRTERNRPILARGVTYEQALEAAKDHVESANTKPTPAPAPAPTGAKTRLDLMLDGVERTGKELNIEVTDANRDNLTKIIETAEKRGLRASTDGRFVLIRPAEPQAKEPWQMTKAEAAEDIRKTHQAAMVKAQQTGEPWDRSWRGQGGRAWGWLTEPHEQAIRIALREGKPVPAEVLADYPDLAKQSPSPAVPQAEGGIFGYSWADIRGKQQGGKLAALIRGNAPKATESDFAVLEKHGMDWLYDNEKFGIIDRLGLPVERPSKKAVEAKATEGQFSIYQMERKDGMKWMVQSGEKRGFGDGIFDTKAEAEEYANTERTRQQERAAVVEREAQKERDEEAAKELRERDVNEYTAAIGATPLAAGKLKKTLMEQVAKRTAGKVYEGTRAQVAKQLLAAGFKPTSEQVDAVKDLTGAQMNRMDNKEQAAHEKRKREAGKKTEYRLENSEGNLFEVTKAEHDYAKWLEAAQVNAAPAPVTEAAALRAKIIKGATVEVSLVRGSKLTHRAKVQDVDTQNGVVTVTFKKGKKFNGGETQTVRLDQVAPLKSVQTRMLNEVQFEGMTEDQKRQTKADAKEFDRLVRDHPEMEWYNWRVEDLAGTKSGDMDIIAERKRASMEAMEALGGNPAWIHKDNSVMKAELLPKLKAAIEEKARELSREAPDSALSDDTDLLPQGEAPEPVASKPTTYINGDKAEYTGETREIAGGTFYVVKFLEGDREGTEGVTQRRPDGTSPDDGRAQAEWQQQQADARKIAAAEELARAKVHLSNLENRMAYDRKRGITNPEDVKRRGELQQRITELEKPAEPATPKLRPSDDSAESFAGVEQSKNHIAFYETAKGEKFELYKRKNGDVDRAPLSTVIDITTGHRSGRDFAPKRMADKEVDRLLESVERTGGKVQRGERASNPKGDMLAGTKEDAFNLSGDIGADTVAEAAAKAQAEKEAAEAKAKFDKEQGNLFDEDPFAIADSAPATSLPVASVQRAVRVVAERLAGAMPHEVIADGSQYPERLKYAMRQLMAAKKWKEINALGRAEILKEEGIPKGYASYAWSGLPESVRDALIKRQSPPTTEDMNRLRGAVSEGKIYINAAAIEKPREAIEVFMHEAAGHGGVDALLQAFGEKATTQLDAMLKRLFEAEYADVKRRYEPQNQVRETLAMIMEGVGPEMSAQHRTRWQRVVDWLRNALNKLGVKQWSTNDVMALLRRGVDAVRKQRARAADVNTLSGNELTYAAREAGVVLTPEETMYVINRDAAVTADVRARVSEARGDGPKMSVAGRVTPEQDRAYADAVKRGDMETAQRMVDAAAKAAGYGVGPVWHGTRAAKAITEFRLSKEGSEEAAFFSDNKDEALQFPYPRGSTSSVRVVLRGDLLEVNAGGELYEPDIMEGWIRDARKAGKDGVHVRDIQNFENGEISDTYAVFDPSQIKSADPITRDESGAVIPLSKRFNPDTSDIRFSLKDENPEATSTTKKAVMDKEREVAMLQGSADKLLQDIRKSGRPPTVEEMQQIAAIDSLIAKRQAEIQAEASNVAQGATPPEINIADMNAEPPDREETGESGPRTYGGKFDSMDAQRAERGLPPLARRFRKANRVLWDAAVKRFETEPKWADRLVDEISSGEKTVLTDEEFAGVFAQQIDLHNKRQEAADRARDPNLSEEEQRDALDQFQYYEKKLQASEILKGMAGSEAGAALQSLKLMANEDFSLAAMEARERKAKQSGLTPEEVDRIRDEATRIAKAQADLDARKAATEAAERIANAEAKIAEWSKIPSRVLEYAKQKLSELVSAGNAAGERLRARAGQVNVGVDPTILGDIFLFARGKIAQGIESFGNFAASTASEFGEWVSPYLKPAWDKAMKYFNANQPERKVSSKQKARQQAATKDAASIEDGIRAMAEEGLPDDMGRYVKQLANEYVKSGATTVKGVMARLHAFLDPVMGNPTDDVLLDLWTDYGKGKAATEDALKRLQSQIRQEALIVRQIIDAEAALVRSQAGEDVGDYLKLTGQQRVPVRDQARALAQQLNELKKKIPPPQGTAESRRQSALDALEKRTRNRIKDLRFEIAKGERTIKNRGVTPTSPNLEALRAELATVEAEHLAVFGRREATPEQKLKSAIKSAERAEQKALAELEAAKRGVFTRPVQKGAETRNEVLVIRARADAARAETQALKELANPPLSDAQKRLDAALVARERWEQMLAGEQQPTSRQPQESLTQLEEDARMEIAAMRELAAQIRRDAKPATDPDDAKVRALEAAAAEYERRVNESDFTAKSKTTTVDSARVAQARALRDAALAAYNAAKNAAGVTEQTKIANRKAAMLRQIADLTDRLAKSDFEKRPPRPPVDLSKDPEAVRIASDLQEIKSNYAKRLLHYIKERRGGYEKFTDAMWTAFTAERSLMGSGDLSAPRQAVRMVKAHPIMAAKAMWRSIRTIFSQKQAVSYEAERKLRPNYALYKPMKIQMPSVEAEAHDRMAEEGVRSNIEDWADIKLSGNPLLVLPKLVPKLLGHYVRASSRTFTTFLNELAADVADYRINELRDKPMSKIEKEALGDMINSGRGRGLKAGAGKLAQFVFYSANFLAARAKNLSGYHIWRRNSSMRIRKIALKEQFRAIAGWMVVSAISRYFYGDTGDDEDMFDKAKRLFKLRVTDLAAGMEYDYTGGEAKLVRIGAALIEGISTTIQAMRSGQEEADKQRAFKSYATIGHTLRDISAPWVGVVSDLFTGSNYDGKVPTVPSIARDLTVPLAWRSADEFFERAGFAKTVGAKLQEAIGVGVSVTRDKTAPKERRYSR